MNYLFVKCVVDNGYGFLVFCSQQTIFCIFASTVNGMPFLNPGIVVPGTTQSEIGGVMATNLFHEYVLCMLSQAGAWGVESKMT